jgi:hypothetical protein
MAPSRSLQHGKALLSLCEYALANEQDLEGTKMTVELQEVPQTSSDTRPEADWHNLFEF